MENDEEDLWLTPPRLRAQKSDVLVQRWAKPRGEEYVLSEYRTAHALPCIKAELLSGSRQGRVLDYLRDTVLGREPVQEDDFEPLLIRLIRKAYALEAEDVTDQKIRAHKDIVEGYCIFENVRKIFKQIGWRAQYFHAALRECERMEPGRLLALLSQQAKGGNECIGRKRFAFSQILDLINPDNGGILGENDQEEAKEETSQDPKEQIWNHTEAFLDDFKEKAFKACFMEPVKLYERATGGDECRIGISENFDLNLLYKWTVLTLAPGNSQVHGSSVYAAVLLSTLGISLPFPPYLDDDANHGRHDFLAVKEPEYVAVLDKLLTPEGFGRDSIGMPGAAKIKVASVSSKFIFDGSTAREVSNNANDPSPNAASKRAQLAPYLERFMGCFTPSFILPSLFNVLNDECADQLQKVFESMKASGQVPADEPDDYRYYLYSEASDFMELDLARAVQFFSAAGILRPEALPMETRITNVYRNYAAEEKRLLALEEKLRALLGAEAIPYAPEEPAPPAPFIPPGHTFYTFYGRPDQSDRVPCGHTPFSWGKP